MLNSKANRVIKELLKNYAPFNNLSSDRLSEVIDILRMIDLRQGEIFRLRGGSAHDYLFLIEGQLDIILSGGIVSLLSANDLRKKPFLLPAAPEICTLVASKDCMICHIDREMLDKLISWDEAIHLHEDESDSELYWRMSMLRNCLVFRSLPLEYIEKAFRRMREVKVKQGDELIRNGEEASTFYILTSGSAEVWRTNLYDNDLHLDEVIGEGSAIGHEALISGQFSNKTVRMLEDSSLLALDKEDFNSIIQKKLVKTVNASIAKIMLENGYKLLDVRYEEEHEESNIPNATLIPLPNLSDRISELNPDAQYITYCHSGPRSEVAAMKLAQCNIEALSLEGGIRDWPYDLNIAAN